MMWGAAILTGLLGSLHCMGMCGPLVLAFPQSSGKQALLYHSARILAYAFLGALTGSIGMGINWAGWQQTLSIVSGVLIVLFALGLLRKKAPIPGFVSRTFQKLAGKNNAGSSLSLGFVNGLLPCGMVYVAMAGALSSGTTWEGALYMLLFGLGTWPMMLAISWSKALWKPSFRLKAMKVVPVFTLLIGVLFVLRGMNLGIPYVSPKTNHETHQVEDCCKKPGHH